MGKWSLLWVQVSTFQSPSQSHRTVGSLEINRLKRKKNNEMTVWFIKGACCQGILYDLVSGLCSRRKAWTQSAVLETTPFQWQAITYHSPFRSSFTVKAPSAPVSTSVSTLSFARSPNGTSLPPKLPTAESMVLFNQFKRFRNKLKKNFMLQTMKF